MEKEAFEPTGLIPRSIIRTGHRFVQQLLPGKEKIALQEYRVSRYQILVSIKSLLMLILIPLILNFTIKALVFTPAIEYFWNSHQAEIFLNQYQEKRAFSEMHDFSEKMFFESLCTPYKPQIKCDALSNATLNAVSFNSVENSLQKQTQSDEKLAFCESTPFSFASQNNFLFNRRLNPLSSFCSACPNKSFCVPKQNRSLLAPFTEDHVLAKRARSPRRTYSKKQSESITLDEGYARFFLNARFLSKFCSAKPTFAPALHRRCTAKKGIANFTSVAVHQRGKATIPFGERKWVSLPLWKQSFQGSKEPGFCGSEASSLTKSNNFRPCESHFLSPKGIVALHRRCTANPLSLPKGDWSESNKGDRKLQKEKLSTLVQFCTEEMRKQNVAFWELENEKEIAKTKLYSEKAKRLSNPYLTHVPYEPLQVQSSGEDRSLVRNTLLQVQSKGTNRKFVCPYKESCVRALTNRKFVDASLANKSTIYSGTLLFHPKGAECCTYKGTQEDTSKMRQKPCHLTFNTKKSEEFHFTEQKQSLYRVEQNLNPSESCLNENLQGMSLGNKPYNANDQTEFQRKSLELAKSYNKQSIVAITNLLGDFFSFFIVSLLFRVMRPELIILKSFLTESVYSLSDTTKSFLLILGMDLLVGFHSPRGWELALEGFLRHIGLPENENFILLFVALFPVFLDTVFKYWIFRYLNKISPSTVVTYHSMIE